MSSVTAAIAAARARRQAADQSTGRFDYFLARIGFRPYPDYETLYKELQVEHNELADELFNVRNPVNLTQACRACENENGHCLMSSELQTELENQT